jgi:hypothetical protein
LADAAGSESCPGRAAAMTTPPAAPMTPACRVATQTGLSAVSGPEPPTGPCSDPVQGPMRAAPPDPKRRRPGPGPGRIRRPAG